MSPEADRTCGYTEASASRKEGRGSALNFDEPRPELLRIDDQDAGHGVVRAQQQSSVGVSVEKLKPAFKAKLRLRR